MSNIADSLRDRLLHAQAVIGIIGLGYVGLPLARACCQAGFTVLGFDTDASKVTALQQGRSYIRHMAIDDFGGTESPRFFPTSDWTRLAEADLFILCVPTPLTEAREPDLRFIEQSARTVSEHLRAGQLVILESTTYPGTTREVVLPILEQRGLRVGEEFFLAYSPEREDPGNPTHSVTAIPKVVGGLDPVSGELAEAFYRHLTPQVVRVSTPEIAEACKLLENTYRAVNIALVNELKILYDKMGIDVWEVIDAAKTKPFGFRLRRGFANLVQVRQR